MSPEHDIYKSHSQQIVIFNIFSGERYVRKQSEILMFVCTMVMYKYMKSFRNGVHNLSDSMHGVHNLSDSMHDVHNLSDSMHDVHNLSDSMHGVHNLSDSMHGVHNLSDSMHEHKKYIKNFLTVLSI
jgi:hypothetical protein